MFDATWASLAFIVLYSQMEYPIGIQTKAEYGRRKSNFAETHSMIVQHNSNTKTTYRMEHNEFSTMVIQSTHPLFLFKRFSY